MKEFTAFINYGCLGKEKMNVYTAESPEGTAKTYDKITCKIPEKWNMEEGENGIIVESPWG